MYWARPLAEAEPAKIHKLGPEPEAIRFCVDLSSVAKAIAFATAFGGKIDAC